MSKTALITKGEFLRGFDCARRLWLDRNRSFLKPPMGLDVYDRMETGKAIGDLARKRYPNGVFAKGEDGESSVEATLRLVEAGQPCIFEATFVAGGQHVRVDVLLRDENGYIVDEVKSSTLREPDKIADDKILDLAFQVLALTQAGLNVEKARLVLVDKDYVWPGGPFDAGRMLATADVTDRCAKVQPLVLARTRELLEVIDLPEAPSVEMNVHCKKCDYFGHCGAEIPEHDVIFLPSITAKVVSQLREKGFNLIPEIPPDHKLTDSRARMRDVIVSGKPHIGDGLSSALSEIPFPAAFIDYESSNPAFPMYPGTHPYEQICFQWSAHILDSPDAPPRHFEFLASDRSDPREAFCRTLWEVVEPCASLVHYSAFERVQLRAMAAIGIPMAAELLEAIETRSVDLEKIVSEHVCLVEFKGRTSIKVVLPALVPYMSYKDLKIGDGAAAAAGFRRMISPETSAKEAEELREALLEYCGQDTLAMVEIYHALRRLVH